MGVKISSHVTRLRSENEKSIRALRQTNFYEVTEKLERNRLKVWRNTGLD